jgi:predicted esterase
MYVPGRMLKPKLRLLCLHGFRQNASSFRGRLGSLQKKLKHVADFVFVDAPHKLPFIQQERCETGAAIQLRHGERGSSFNEASCRSPTWKYAWLVSPRDACANELEDVKEGEEPSGGTSRATKTPFDAWQYETQTEGWDTSWEYLQKVFQDLDPFDGVLGFSQGAAVAAALCQLRQTSPSDASVQFKFAVLCSGYPPPLPFFEKGMAFEAGIPCPSLHIYGGQDRQIHDHTSAQLSYLFQSEERTIVKHACGHIIPTQPAYIEQYVQFFSRFL